MAQNQKIVVKWVQLAYLLNNMIIGSEIENIVSA